jgi:hypothetical protein
MLLQCEGIANTTTSSDTKSLRKTLMAAGNGSILQQVAKLKADRLPRRTLMLSQRLPGLMLVIAGSACILVTLSPFHTVVPGSAALFGFCLFVSGSAFIALRDHNDRQHGGVGLLRLRRSSGKGPAKRLKIRIRCAR